MSHIALLLLMGKCAGVQNASIICEKILFLLHFLCIFSVGRIFVVAITVLAVVVVFLLWHSILLECVR